MAESNLENELTEQMVKSSDGSMINKSHENGVNKHGKRSRDNSVENEEIEKIVKKPRSENNMDDNIEKPIVKNTDTNVDSNSKISDKDMDDEIIPVKSIENIEIDKSERKDNDEKSTVDDDQELPVECSDNSSEHENDGKDEKKENLESDMSASESENSDENKSRIKKKDNTETIVNNKAKKARVSESKDSEIEKDSKIDDNSDDDKHNANGKKAKRTLKKDKVNEKSNTKNGTEKKRKITKSSDSSSEDDSASDKSNNGEKKGSKFEYKVNRLKKFIKAAGIRVKRYNDLWSDCKTDNQKLDRLKKLLEDNGISGKPTLEKCQEVKAKRELDREKVDIDPNNIISEERVTRSRVSSTMKKSTEPSSPIREIYKRMRNVVDSDSE